MMQSQSLLGLPNVAEWAHAVRKMVPIGLMQGFHKPSIWKKQKAQYLQSGIEQGMPVLEVLARTVRQEKEIRGI